VEDTVGSGDSFLAAILARMMEGAAMEEALAFANRLAAFITTQQGACPDYELKDMDTMLIPKLFMRH
jgi:fructokinase